MFVFLELTGYVTTEHGIEALKKAGLKPAGRSHVQPALECGAAALENRSAEIIFADPAGYAQTGEDGKGHVCCPVLYSLWQGPDRDREAREPREMSVARTWFNPTFVGIAQQ